MRYAEALARKVEEFCALDYGYDQGDRWGVNEVDCSSLIYRAIYAIDPETKLNRHDPRYTGTLYRDLTAIGFRAVPLAQRQRGDVLLNVTHHVMTYLGNGIIGGARIDERGKAAGGRGGDQTGREVSTQAYYNYPWDWCLRPPAVDIMEEDEDEVTDADKNDIATRVWTTMLHGWNGDVRACDRLTGADFASNQALSTTDPTGRGMELTDHDHIKYIGAKVADIEHTLGELSAKLDKLTAGES